MADLDSSEEECIEVYNEMELFALKYDEVDRMRVELLSLQRLARP